MKKRGKPPLFLGKGGEAGGLYFPGVFLEEKRQGQARGGGKEGQHRGRGFWMGGGLAGVKAKSYHFKRGGASGGKGEAF